MRNFTELIADENKSKLPTLRRQPEFMEFNFSNTILIVYCNISIHGTVMRSTKNLQEIPMNRSTFCCRYDSINIKEYLDLLENNVNLNIFFFARATKEIGVFLFKMHQTVWIQFVRHTPTLLKWRCSDLVLDNRGGMLRSERLQHRQGFSEIEFVQYIHIRENSHTHTTQTINDKFTEETWLINRTIPI